MGKRIRIFTGHFGSGKTEIAINYASKLRDEGKKVCIADLDIVNPYFCSRDVEDFFNQKGIRLISTPKELANAELSTVSGEVMSVFNDKSLDVVLDVGGDDMGAVVLGQYNRYFQEEDYDMFFVINTRRYLTGDADSIVDYIREIEKASRLKVNYLISNTNLSYQTTVEDVIEGNRIALEVSNKTNIPIKYTVVEEKLLNEINETLQGEVLPIKIFMRPAWVDYK